MEGRNGALTSASDRVATLVLLELLLAPGREVNGVVGATLVRLEGIAVFGLDGNGVAGLSGKHGGRGASRRAVKVVVEKTLAVVNIRHGLGTEEYVDGRRAGAVVDRRRAERAITRRLGVGGSLEEVAVRGTNVLD
jgi:hypothetical protein